MGCIFSLEDFTDELLVNEPITNEPLQEEYILLEPDELNDDRDIIFERFVEDNSFKLYKNM